MIFIPKGLRDVILAAPEGSLVRGTYNTADRAGALVSVDLETPVAFVHPGVGRIGRPDSMLPLTILRKGTNIGVRAQNTGDVDVRIYESSAYHARNPFDPEVMAFLKARRVLVVGLGSVGSVLTKALAQAGIGRIAGSDPDGLEIHNCMRHALGTAFVGWNKAAGMAQWMRTACPDCEFTSVPYDLFSGDRNELKRFLDAFKPDVIAAFTDSRNPQILSQMAAMYCGATFFAMGCFNNAIEGEVFIRLPESPIPVEDDRIGYACYDDLHPPAKGERPARKYDYSSDIAGRYAGEPALGHLINHKTYLAAAILVDTLLFKATVRTRASEATHRHLSRGAQYLRIGGPYLTEGIKALGLEKPWEVRWGRLRRHSDCEVCGDDVDVAAALFPSYGDDIEMDDDF